MTPTQRADGRERKPLVFVRPSDIGGDWCVDQYDRRGVWQYTRVAMPKREAFAFARRLRADPAVHP